MTSTLTETKSSWTHGKKRTSQERSSTYSRYRVHGCVLAETFLEHGEKELGCLYCYVDSAKSMAADPSKKLMHTACEVTGDRFCAFGLVPTTEKERKDFQEKNVEWKEVDPILIKGSRMDKDRKGKISR